MLAKELLAAGCYQVSLGDTIGVGTPIQTQRIVELFAREIPLEKIALHLHDTRGTALANVVAGLEPGLEYQFQVRSINSAGMSTSSALSNKVWIEEAAPEPTATRITRLAS